MYYCKYTLLPSANVINYAFMEVWDILYIKKVRQG